MAAKNVGTLILEGRTAKKLSQTALGNAAGGVSGSDIGKAERGEKELTQAQLKAIAKALGITQKSLLEAPKGGTATAAAKKTASTGAKTTTAAKKTTAKTKTGTAAKTSSASKTSSTAKTTAKKTTSAKTTAAKTNTAKTTSTAKKTTAAVTASNLSTTEKKLVELYRAADSDSKKLATRILKGEKLELGELLMLMNSNGSEDGLLGSLLGKMQGMMK